MATDPADIPHGMRRVYRRFERWRSEHSGARLPIPEPLWASAAEVAREHGVFHTAKVLRLEYGKLKRRVQSATATVGKCVIEFESSAGSKMRIQWKGTTAPDLAGLSR